ncbi:AraC family transcriptional regulator [uncultured Limosilactobacillus sp.]|uniref:helix-turn-helix domain-containing protein n=1 Tax=uncultured Limosilactobacillus sp. TaxID=2837629 RepID=UPI0025EE4288|nr:AraC family transcriptional regulator [uncultured Limosilactobacillus sp.]
MNKYINSKNINANSDFPYLVLDVVNQHAKPINPGFNVMHWHNDLQFIYVLNGTIQIKTLEKSEEIVAGNGAFINQNVVHQVNHRTNSHYRSFIFPAYFLDFYFGGPTQRLVEELTLNQSLELINFKLESKWAAVCNKLNQLSQLFENNRQSHLYPYEVLTALVSIFLEIQKRVSLPQQKQDSNAKTRVKAMLEYIQKNYSQKITLAELAKSANISKAECNRCFHSILQTSPYNYLLEYRLSKAAELLKKTKLPISVVANQVGFSQASQFGKYFKAKTSLTPLQFRKS